MTIAAALVVVIDCGREAAARGHTLVPNAARRASPAEIEPPPGYAGRDGNGVPHYAGRAFTPEETSLLRDVFGVDDPRHLYLTDASPFGVLTCDLSADRGWNDQVYSFHLGFVSTRRAGESWRDFVRRVQRMSPSDYSPSVRVADTSLEDLDPSVRPLFEQLIAASKARGFDVRVVDGYRSPEREAYLLSLADGHTYTATSFHSYGRAVDFVIANCDTSSATGRNRYAAFRRFALAYGGGRLRLIGTVDRTWDWNHIEAPARWLGYHRIEDALTAARFCVARNGARCLFESPAVGAARLSASKVPKPPENVVEKKARIASSALFKVRAEFPT